MAKLFHASSTPHSLANSRGRDPAHSLASSLASSRGSESDGSVHFGTPDFSDTSPYTAGTGSPAPPVSAMKRLSHLPSSTSSSHAPPPNSLASSYGRSQTHFSNAFYNYGEIGKGSFGVCYHVSDIVTGVDYAVKQSLKPFRGENDRAARRREVDNLKRIVAVASEYSQAGESSAVEPAEPPIPTQDDHKHIVRFYSAWEEQGSLFIQTELLHGGTVRQFLENCDSAPSDAMLWTFLLDLCRGLRFLHDRAQLVHLDLKWENIFIQSGTAPDDGRLKIGDLGTSMNLQERAQQFASINQPKPAASTNATVAHKRYSTDEFNDESLCIALAAPVSVPDVDEGDRVYLAPESLEPSLLEGDPISSATDIFSLGLMMLEATCDVQLPTHGPGWTALRHGELDQSWNKIERVDPELKDVITQMCSRRPRARPTAAQILTHPRLVALARSQNNPARDILRNIPSVLPTTSREQFHPVGKGLLLNTNDIATSDDSRMNSSHSSPVVPRSRMPHHHTSTPTSLSYALSQCDPNVGIISSNTDDAFSRELSAALFSSASYSRSNSGSTSGSRNSSFSGSSPSLSTSASSSSSRSSSHPSFATIDAELHDALQGDDDRIATNNGRLDFDRNGGFPSHSSQSSLPLGLSLGFHPPMGSSLSATASSRDPLLNIRELSKSTRRTVSSHTQRHAVKGLHSLPIARFTPAPQPVPIVNNASNTAPPSTSSSAFMLNFPSTPTGPMHSIRSSTHSNSDIESESEESHMPARNLFAAFDEADED